MDDGGIIVKFCVIRVVIMSVVFFGSAMEFDT